MVGDELRIECFCDPWLVALLDARREVQLWSMSRQSLIPGERFGAEKRHVLQLCKNTQFLVSQVRLVVEAGNVREL